MQIKVFKSEHTGELFENETDYNLHLENYKSLKEQEEIKKELFKKANEMKQMPRLTSTSIEEFRKKAFDIINELNYENPDKLLLMEFNNIYFTDVSNSHSSPIGCPTNFSRKSDLPMYHNGWYGNITIVFSQDRNTGANRDKIEHLTKQFPAINTGSGGYRGAEFNGIKGYVLEYDLRLYLDDFPLIKEQYEQYKELKLKKEEWEKNVNLLIEEKNENDKLISSYKKTKSKLIEKIQKLEEEEQSVDNLMNEKIKENKEQILSENTFHELNELDIIVKNLNIKRLYS